MSNLGFIKIPRSLLRDPLWIDLPSSYKEVFFVILENVYYKPTRFDDHGHLIDLMPGQICISERELLKRCGKFVTRIEVQRAIKRLSCVGYLSQEVRHKKSILTITYSEFYESIKNENAPTSEPNLSQTRAIKEERKKDKKNIYSSDSIEFGLATYFFQQIQTFLSDARPPNFQKWSKDIDAIIRIDKRSADDVKKYISWMTKDIDFWQGKILSPDKLRKQWDKLTLAMKKPKKSSEIDENKIYSQKAFNELISEFCELKLDTSEIVFIPLSGQQLPFALKYSENGFKDQLIGILKKKGFKQKIGSSKVEPMPLIRSETAILEDKEA
jgi:hypothetical protein